MDHSTIVALCQHGRLFVRYRCPSCHSVSAGVCGFTLDNPLHQHPRYHTRLLLLDFRTKVWVAPDGSVEILLRISWRQD